ncbi:uncharacterized protein PpBr36_11441, partial [Pyricularia pennisetigena]
MRASRLYSRQEQENTKNIPSAVLRSLGQANSDPVTPPTLTSAEWETL